MNPNLKLVGLNELLSDDSSPPKPVIDNGVLLDGTLLLLIGPPKSKKTFLTMNLALSIASGSDFSGFKIPKPKKVLYLLAEGGFYPTKERLKLPFGIITSAFLLNENISKNKWLLIFTSFFGILIIFFDPKLSDNFLGLFYASLMALFFGLAQVYSRQLKELDTSIINVSTGLFGFVILIIVSSVIEGETINSIKLINLESWILIFYQAIIVSLCAHLLMFYLYKFYTVGKIFPFYSLFPIFGISLSFIIFGEVPSFLFLLGGIIVISSVILLHKID